MDFGDVLIALGLDLRLLQGAVSHIYLRDESLQHLAGDGFRLDLAVPLVETREPCGPLPFRMGVHLLGDLFIGTQPVPVQFDAYVRLAPGVLDDDAGMPVGALRFDGVEFVKPDAARTQLVAAFQPGGRIGDLLAGLQLPLFENLLESATRAFQPPADPDDPVEVHPADWSVALSLGQPAELPRPVYDVAPGDEVVLEFETTSMTVPALVATVAHSASSPLMPGGASIVRGGSGLQLMTAKAMFDARLDTQSAATVGTEIEGLTVDKLELEAVDGGITVDGSGHKTGADVTFVGTMVARYAGGTDGHLYMKPAIDTDVDTAWWVDVLSVVAALVPGLGWILGDALIWGPKAEAPGQIDDALSEEFGTTLRDVAAEVAAGFHLEAEPGEDPIPSAAFLDDLWIFDGNLAVSVAAFLGYNPVEITAVSLDRAFVILPKKLPRKKAKKPVASVGELTLSTGQVVRPWQAAALVRDGIVDIPDHHVVRNPRAREGIFLRSDPNETPSDNLIR